MATTMHAAIVTGFSQFLAVQDWPIPTPGPGQILVRTEACGVCHTGVHAAHRDWPDRLEHGTVPWRAVLESGNGTA